MRRYCATLLPYNSGCTDCSNATILGLLALFFGISVTLKVCGLSGRTLLLLIGIGSAALPYSLGNGIDRFLFIRDFHDFCPPVVVCYKAAKNMRANYALFTIDEGELA